MVYRLGAVPSVMMLVVASLVAGCGSRGSAGTGGHATTTSSAGTGGAATSTSSAGMGGSGAIIALLNNQTVVIAGDTYTAQNDSRSWSCEELSSTLFRFEVRSGDVWPSDPATKNRSELVGSTLFAPGVSIEVSYGFEVEAGSPITAAWLVAGQFHQVESNGYSPPFEINFNGNDKMGVAVNYVYWKASVYRAAATETTDMQYKNLNVK